MTNASVLPRLSHDADARMRAAIDHKSSIATHYIPIISVRNPVVSQRFVSPAA